MSKSMYSVAVKCYPKTHDKVIQYGTAGFRTKAEDLSHIVFRMGILAVLRSRNKKSAVIGLMITASHNPANDNGIKLIDPDGEMLDQAWESIATKLANTSDESLDSVIQDIAKQNDINMTLPGNVFIGQDTRPSSKAFAAAASLGVTEFGGTVSDYGVVTTPILHYLTKSYNTQEAYGICSCEGYMEKLSNAFREIRGKEYNCKSYKSEIYFDGANGVGAIIMKQFLPYLKGSLDVKIYHDNVEKSELLNLKCGADFVKVNQGAPEFMTKANVRCVSFDGDADRIVYYFTDSNNKFNLLDGDRIATLVAGYLMSVIRDTGLNVNLGLVQTAYANGSSTNYISGILKVPVSCVPTGVKYLHHKAVEYDVGIYFEANGHGTVTFSEKFKAVIKDHIASGRLDPDKQSAVNHLKLLIDLINETVGDSLSDMLLVETILHARGWSIEDWLGTYTDLPNRQLKVIVKDRNVVKTRDAERYCVSPDGVQDAIDAAVKLFPNGRSFIRPSGTEDVVRVYAEAATQNDADALAEKVVDIVRKLAGGI